MCHMRIHAAFGALGICAHRNTVRAQGGWVRESLLGPCSLLMVALDASTNIRNSLPLFSIPPPPLSLSLVLPLYLWGIAHSPLQKRHQLRSAPVRRNTIFDNLSPLAEYSADILVPPRPQIPAQCGLFRSHLLVICAAKPRYTAAAAREHRRVLAPRLPTPVASVTSPLHAP
jgi:hypothetical protein